MSTVNLLSFNGIRKAVLVVGIILFTQFGLLAQWAQNSAPGVSGTYDIQFLDSQNGFVGTNSFVFKTTNGGATWSSPTQYATPFDFEMLTSAQVYDIHFKTSTEGYVVGGGFFGLYNIVAKTTDGGVNWTLQYFDAVPGGLLGQPLKSVAFRTNMIGFAVGGSGKVLNTTDGGTTWNPITGLTSKDLEKVLFLDDQTGFIAGNDVVLKTVDGGATWQQANFPGNGLIDLHFYDALNGIATAHTGLYNTTDGGLTWHPDATTSGIGNLGKISFSGLIGLIAGNPALSNPFVLTTFDKGVTWQRMTTPYPSGFYAVNLVGSTGWGAASTGNLYKATLSLAATQPIASFQKNSSTFCENISYAFTNNSYPQYASEWRVDGILRSSSHDFTYTFPDGQHTIELKVIDGSRVGTNQITINFDNDLPFTEAVNIAYANGICEGQSTTIRVTEPPFANTFSLYRANGELIGQKGYNYPTISFESVPLNESETMLLKLSRSNACATFVAEKEVPITVYEPPTATATIAVGNLDICNSGTSSITIGNSSALVQYDLLRVGGGFISSLPGNGGSISLPTGNLRDTTNFFVRGKYINGSCQAYFDTLTVNVEKVKAKFTLSRVNATSGEPVSFYNRSIGATQFEWLLPDGSHSFVASPNSAAFSLNAGTYPVQLSVASVSGCSDVSIGSINIVEESSNYDCWATGFDFDNEPNAYNYWDEVFSIDHTASGDIIMTGVMQVDAQLGSMNNSEYSLAFKQGTATFLARYSNAGNLKWAFPIIKNRFVNGSTPTSKVKVAPDGSIYVRPTNQSFDRVYYSIDGDSLVIPYSYPGAVELLRYSEEGILMGNLVLDIGFQPGDFFRTPMNMDVDAAGNIWVLTDKILKFSSDLTSFIQVNDASDQFALTQDGSIYSVKRENQAVLLSRYNNDGVLEWEHSIPVSSGYPESLLEVDGIGNAYLALEGTPRTVQFPSSDNQGSGPLTAAYFLSKYDVAGKLEWVNTAQGSAVGPTTLSVGNDGSAFVTMFTLEALLTDRAGTQFSLNSDLSTYLFRFGPDGIIQFQRHLFDWPIGNIFIPHDISSAAFQDRVTLMVPIPSFSNTCFINGNAVDRRVVLAQIGAYCGTVSEKATLSIDMETEDWYNEMCPGFSFDLNYEVLDGYSIPPDNIFTVYLSGETGLFYNPTVIGTLVSTSQRGTIRVTLPNNMPFNNYKIWMANDGYPKLYSNAFNISNYINSNTSLSKAFEFSKDKLSVTLNALGHPSYTYEWKINGNTLTGKTITYTFPQQGSYYVDLKTTSACGVSIVGGMFVDVFCEEEPVTQSYSINQKTVNFEAAEFPGATYHWTFGDGASSNLRNPTHTFDTWEIKQVTLTVTRDCGPVTVLIQVDLGCAPLLPAISVSKNNLTAQFTNTTTETQNSYLWNFGDGQTSIEKNPTHIYANAGNYAVTLREFNACSENIVSQIVSLVCPSLNPTIGLNQDGLAVQFGNTTSTSGSTFLWLFGDGSTSTLPSPIHNYSTAGTYMVSLTESNDCSTTTVTKEVHVSCPLPSLSYTTTVNNRQVTLVTSNGALETFTWNFGDGVIQETSGTSATHTYTAGGIYSVCVTAMSPCGQVSFCSDVTIVCPSLNPTIGLNQNGLAVQFGNTTSTSGSTFLWLFGDGSTSTLPNPIHNYSTAGTYMVSLTESNDCSTTTATKEVHVSCPVPSPQFSFTINKQEVSFQNESANATSYKWDFGDGTQSVTSQSVLSHTYTSQGAFQVCLQAINACESIAICQLLVVCTPPEVDFTFETISVGTVAFNSSYNAVGYSWYFGDGNYSSKKSPQHDFLDGTYQVCLTLSNGCLTSQICKSVTVVCPKPIANFAFEVQSGTQVKLTNTSTNSTFTDWDFGDGAGTLEDSPVHEFQEGNFEVCLEVQNNCGVDQLCQTISIVLTGGIEDKPKWTVYPNPFEESIRIENSFEGAVTIRVQSVLGVNVHTAALQESKTLDIDTRHWVAGIYILAIESRGKSQVTTLIKK